MHSDEDIEKFMQLLAQEYMSALNIQQNALVSERQIALLHEWLCRGVKEFLKVEVSVNLDKSTGTLACSWRQCLTLKGEDKFAILLERNGGTANRVSYKGEKN